MTVNVNDSFYICSPLPLKIHDDIKIYWKHAVWSVSNAIDFPDVIENLHMVQKYSAIYFLHYLAEWEEPEERSQEHSYSDCKEESQVRCKLICPCYTYMYLSSLRSQYFFLSSPTWGSCVYSVLAFFCCHSHSSLYLILFTIHLFSF